MGALAERMKVNERSPAEFPMKHRCCCGPNLRMSGRPAEVGIRSRIRGADGRSGMSQAADDAPEPTSNPPSQALDVSRLRLQKELP